MSDHVALLAAVMERPEQDTPRLALADYLDDTGTTAHAALIRGMVRGDLSGPRLTGLVRRVKGTLCAPLVPTEPRRSGLVGQHGTAGWYKGLCV